MTTEPSSTAAPSPSAAASSADRARVSGAALTNPFASPAEGFCELLLVRHGEQQYVEGMALGDAHDPPLSELGRQQAHAVGQRLAGLAVDAVYASPLQRALATGTAIANPHGHAVTVLEDLREVELWAALPQHLGLVEAVGTEELRRIFKAVQVERTWDAYPYGEGTASFRRRISRALDHIVHRHLGDRVVVACHGGVISTVLAMILDSPRDYGIAVHHTSITIVRAADDRRTAVSVNDFAHVLGFQTELNPLNLY